MVVDHHIVLVRHVRVLDLFDLQKMGRVASDSEFRNEADAYLAHSISERDHMPRNESQTKCL